MLYLGAALFKFWFQTDLRRENSASYYPLQAGQTVAIIDFYHLGHALVTLYVQFYALSLYTDVYSFIFLFVLFENIGQRARASASEKEK